MAVRRESLERQRVGGRGKTEFEHRSRFSGRQEEGGGLGEGRTETVEQTGRWSLATWRTGGSWVLGGSHRRATLVSPPPLAASPPRSPGWWRGTGR